MTTETRSAVFTRMQNRAVRQGLDALAQVVQQEAGFAAAGEAPRIEQGDPHAVLRYAGRSLARWDELGRIGMVRLTPPNLNDQAGEDGLRPSDQIRAVLSTHVDEGDADPGSTVLIERNYGHNSPTILFAADADQALWTANPSGPDHSIPQFPGFDRK